MSAVPIATVYLSESDGEHVADSVAALVRQHGSLRRVSEALGLSRWIVHSLAGGAKGHRSRGPLAAIASANGLALDDFLAKVRAPREKAPPCKTCDEGRQPCNEHTPYGLPWEP